MQYSEQNFQLEEESSKESLRANLKPLPASCKILSRLPIKLPTLRKKFAKLKIGFDWKRCNFQTLAILQILSRGYMSDFFACNSDALSKMLHCQCAENHKFSQPHAGCVTSLYFVAKASVHWISRNFFWYFQLSHHLCKGGYMCDFHRITVTRRQLKNRITIATEKSLV